MVATRVQLPNSAVDRPIDVAATAHNKPMSRGPQPPTFGNRAKNSAQKMKKTTSFNIMPTAWAMKAARYSRAAWRLSPR